MQRAEKRQKTQVSTDKIYPLGVFDEAGYIHPEPDEIFLCTIPTKDAEAAYKGVALHPLCRAVDADDSPFYSISDVGIKPFAKLIDARKAKKQDMHAMIHSTPVQTLVAPADFKQPRKPRQSLPRFRDKVHLVITMDKDEPVCAVNRNGHGSPNCRISIKDDTDGKWRVDLGDGQECLPPKVHIHALRRIRPGEELFA